MDSKLTGDLSQACSIEIKDELHEVEVITVIELDSHNNTFTTNVTTEELAIRSVTHSDLLCEICQSSLSKYTCPGCGVKTCSLPCVKEHKMKLDCSGERDKTSFVDIRNYSDMHLLNDYRFLEDSERRLYSNKMVPENRRRTVAGAPYHLNKRSKLLMTAAYKRGVNLKMVSSALTKNKTNTSFYTISSDTIGWHIEWHFVSTNTIIKDEKVPETTILLEAASKHTNFVQYPSLRKCLEDYRKDRLNKCRLLLKVEGLPANRIRYFELKPTLTIAENLRGHCLTEYPTIMVLSASSDQTEYILLSKNDLHVMSRENSNHLAKHFPELDIQTALETTLLNPKSSLYAVELDSTCN
uniref:Box C/D snoRNA protein 1 n=1 Tax=Arion vulgaris TaxID=1028688 RepID=A0A0B7BJQ3_9EUPU